MTVRHIQIEQIDRSGRLRPVNPVWVQAMAERIAAGDRLPPIEVVERADGSFRLIAGGHRTEAHIAAGLAEIEADVRPASEFSSDAAIRLREIQENIVRYELTALDRAVHLAEWKRCHEEIHGAAKPGRKALRQDPAAMAKPVGIGPNGEPVYDPVSLFAATFSTSAATALRISERSVRVAVQVAGKISPEVRERIAFHPIADVMMELLALAQETAPRQIKIAALLLAEPAQARTVAEAIAHIDRTPDPAKLAGWEKISDRFVRLKEADRHAFYRVHLAEIRAFLASEEA